MFSYEYEVKEVILKKTGLLIENRLDRRYCNIN
jgi:hypothetical protein